MPDQPRDEHGRWTAGAALGHARYDEKGKSSKTGSYANSPLKQAAGKGSGPLKEAINSVGKAPSGYSTIEDVEAKDLFSGQSTVNVGVVQSYLDTPDREAAKGADGKKSPLPLVARVGDRMVVVDGNHRVAAAAIKGEKIRAKVVDFGRALTDAKELQAKNPTYGIYYAMDRLKPGGAKIKKIKTIHDTKAVQTAEKILPGKLAKILRKIGREAAAAASKASEPVLGKAKPSQQAAIDAIAAAAFSGADWSLLIDPTDAQLQAIVRDGAYRALLTLGVADDESIVMQTYEAAAEWATERSAEMVGRTYNAAGDLVENPNAEMAITDTTRDEIRAAVADAVDRGLSAADLADNIEELGSFSPERAEMIARTEVIRANNQGHLEAFRSSGVVKQKEWSCAPDACDECQANEDQGPIDLDDAFESGDDAPPGHPNCRCTIVPVVDEEPSDAEADDEEESGDR